MVSKQFRRELFKIIHKNFFNDYNDNWDPYRYGVEPKDRINSVIKQNLTNVMKYLKYFINSTGLVYFPSKSGSRDAMESFDYLYNLLESESDKGLLIDLVVFRILGYKKIKLSVNSNKYWEGVKQFEKLANEKDIIQVKFNNYKLPRVNFKSLDESIELYFSGYGIYVDFILEQYQYKSLKKIIRVQSEDIVIDAGGCWGDTAIYFANAIGDKGRVYTFEFIPSNLIILNKNLALNPVLSNRITVVERPVWNISDLTLRYIDNGPASKVFFEEHNNLDGEVKTLTIDDLVNRNSLAKVNFIKMDIEGAELNALKGAVETIKRFKPTLAIAIYHSVNDFMDIPRFINELGLGYKFYLGHYTIHLEETILFAEAND